MNQELAIWAHGYERSDAAIATCSGVPADRVRTGRCRSTATRRAASVSAELGRDEVKEVATGAARYQAQMPNVRLKTVAVTNQTFTSGARRHAELNCVELVGRDQVEGMLARYPIRSSEFEDRALDMGVITNAAQRSSGRPGEVHPRGVSQCPQTTQSGRSTLTGNRIYRSRHLGSAYKRRPTRIWATDRPVAAVANRVAMVDGRPHADMWHIRFDGTGMDFDFPVLLGEISAVRALLAYGGRQLESCASQCKRPSEGPGATAQSASCAPNGVRTSTPTLMLLKG